MHMQGSWMGVGVCVWVCGCVCNPVCDNCAAGYDCSFTLIHFRGVQRAVQKSVASAESTRQPQEKEEEEGSSSTLGLLYLYIYIYVYVCYVYMLSSVSRLSKYS